MEIADQESIKEATVTGILSGDLSSAESVTNQLTTTFSNQSFSDSVGGDGTFKKSRAVSRMLLFKSKILL